MEAIHHLAGEIGPRPPCSEAETRAARWVTERLEQLGYDVAVEEFESRPCYQSWYAVYIGIAFVGALLVVVLPLVACFLGVISFVLYARDSEGRPLVQARGGRSRNVIAKNTDLPKVVVVAHIDSALTSLSFHPRLVGSFRASVRLLNAALLLVVALGAGAYVVEVGGELYQELWVPAGLVAAYLLFALTIQLVARLRSSAVPGANDNASGVEVLLRLAADRPRDTWFVATGSEEAGMVGIQRFIENHGVEVTGAWFLNIDNVGKGRLIVSEEEGAILSHSADAQMLRIAEAAGAEVGSFRGLPTDATVLMARKHRAVSLVAVSERGVPPNWHWRTDVVSEVDPASIDAATEVGRRVVVAQSLQEAEA